MIGIVLISFVFVTFFIGISCVYFLDKSRPKDSGKLGKVIEKINEDLKKQKEWEEKCHNFSVAQNEIANLRELRLYFQTTTDFVLGQMEICYGIDNMPTYLKAFKCSMERINPNNSEDDEIQSILIFARNIEDIVEYMNAYQAIDENASGFTCGVCSYIYDGGLREVRDLQNAIKYSNHAFVIDRCTGRKWRREHKNN